MSKWKIYTTVVHKAQVLKAQPPGRRVGFGLPPRCGAPFRSKLREPSACCLLQSRALLVSPPPPCNCLQHAELTLPLCGTARTKGQSLKDLQVLSFARLEWLAAQHPWHRATAVGCMSRRGKGGCRRRHALTSGILNAVGPYGLM